MNFKRRDKLGETKNNDHHHRPWLACRADRRRCGTGGRRQRDYSCSGWTGSDGDRQPMHRREAVKTIIKTIRVMLIPNNKQKTKLFQYANTARFAYNWALGREQENYKKL